MVAIPLVKLFSMTIKTLAKPMSKTIKTEAQRHPRFRGVLSAMGQATNNISARISIGMAGHTTTKIKPLEEDKAIAAGGDLLAEGFIYGLGTFLMVFEYISSAREKEEKEAKAKLKKEEEKRELAQALQDINQRLAKLEAVVQPLSETHTNQGKGGNDRNPSPEGGKSVLGLSIRLPRGRDAEERESILRRSGSSLQQDGGECSKGDRRGFDGGRSCRLADGARQR